MTEEDLKGVNVFVGNNLKDIKTLKYCKVDEKMEKFVRADEDYQRKNSDFMSQPQHIINLKNDDHNGKGTFLLVKNVIPQKIMEQKERSLNSFYNFPEPT
jgi:hypothetical protein